jgi:rubredoxin
VINKTLYQCRECRFIWNPAMGRWLRCQQCNAEQYFEALDTWCFGGNEVSLRALRNMASNIATGAALCAVWQKTRNNTAQWISGHQVLWMPGCRRAAP